MGEYMSSFVTSGLELGRWFEICSDGHGSRGPVRKSVRSSAVTETDGETFGLDKCTDLLDETLGCFAGKKSWCDRVKIVT